MQLPRVFISMSHAVIDTGSWAFGEHSALLATNAQQVGDSETLNTLYLPGFAACQRPARCSVLLVITLFDSSERASPFASLSILSAKQVHGASPPRQDFREGASCPKKRACRQRCTTLVYRSGMHA